MTPEGETVGVDDGSSREAALKGEKRAGQVCVSVRASSIGHRGGSDPWRESTHAERSSWPKSGQDGF